MKKQAGDSPLGFLSRNGLDVRASGGFVSVTARRGRRKLLVPLDPVDARMVSAALRTAADDADKGRR